MQDMLYYSLQKYVWNYILIYQYVNCYYFSAWIICDNVGSGTCFSAGFKWIWKSAIGLDPSCTYVIENLYSHCSLGFPGVYKYHDFYYLIFYLLSTLHCLISPWQNCIALDWYIAWHWKLGIVFNILLSWSYVWLCFGLVELNNGGGGD